MEKRRVFQFALAAVMAALAGVLDAFTSIRIGTHIKFTLYGLPLLFTGIMYGPFIGFLAGLVAGIIAQLFSPYGLTLTTPIWVIAPVLWGGISGFISYLLKHKYTLPNIIVMVVVPSILATSMNSLAIYLDALIMKYPSQQTWISILIRLGTASVLSIFYIAILYVCCNRLKGILWTSSKKEK